jgi:predicted TIM-barrel fold metal-dependent hydrolase
MTAKREGPDDVSRRSFLQTVTVAGAAVLTGGMLYGERLLAQAPPPGAKAAPRPGCIDVHYHYVPPVYLDALPPADRLPPLKSWTPARALEDLDRGGTATAILSVTTPGVSFGGPAANRALARTCNEYAARMVADHGRRYGMFVALPLPDIDASLRELEYGLDTLKADGVGFFTSYDDKYLGHPQYAPVLEELNRRQAVLYTHPRACNFCSGLVPEVNDATIEYGTDTTRTIASLLFSGAAGKYPDIRFIFSHAGGTMPFLIERFRNVPADSPAIAARMKRDLMTELQRFYYDTAQSSNPISMAALTKVVPTSQVVFGTDFPFRTTRLHVDNLAQCGFTSQELRAIYRENALRLLPKYKEA